jgi:hypothetical protein
MNIDLNVQGNNTEMNVELLPTVLKNELKMNDIKKIYTFATTYKKNYLLD